MYWQRDCSIAQIFEKPNQRGIFMFRTATFAAFLLSAVAVPATAAEFSGFRAELQGGWDNPQVTYDVYSAAGVYQGQYHQNHSGFMYGAEVGYDLPVSETIRLGVLASIGGTTVSIDPEAQNLLYSTNANVGFNWNLAARAGFKVGDSTMLYGSVGYASTNIKYYVNNLVTPALSFEDSRTYGGFLFAGGVEQALGESFYGRLEYRYSNYQSGVSRNQIVAGFGMRF
jgi:outer membrane immunogenic protein